MRFKKIALPIIILLITLSSKAQLLMSKTDVTEEYGDDYKTGTTDDGKDYIFYEKELETDASGKYIQQKVIYFVELAEGEKFCNAWKIIEPSSEANSVVNHIMDEGLVKVDNMQWKDYETNILYHVKVDEGLCILTAIYDEEN